MTGLLPEKMIVLFSSMLKKEEAGLVILEDVEDGRQKLEVWTTPWITSPELETMLNDPPKEWRRTPPQLGILWELGKCALEAWLQCSSPGIPVGTKSLRELKSALDKKRLQPSTEDKLCQVLEKTHKVVRKRKDEVAAVNLLEDKTLILFSDEQTSPAKSLSEVLIQSPWTLFHFFFQGYYALSALSSKKRKRPKSTKTRKTKIRRKEEKSDSLKKVSNFEFFLKRRNDNSFYPLSPTNLIELHATETFQAETHYELHFDEKGPLEDQLYLMQKEKKKDSYMEIDVVELFIPSRRGPLGTAEKETEFDEKDAESWIRPGEQRTITHISLYGCDVDLHYEYSGKFRITKVMWHNLQDIEKERKIEILSQVKIKKNC